MLWHHAHARPVGIACP